MRRDLAQRSERDERVLYSGRAGEPGRIDLEQVGGKESGDLLGLGPAGELGRALRPRGRVGIVCSGDDIGGAHQSLEAARG